MITSCVHVRNLHQGANVYPGANLLHRICTTYKYGANSHRVYVIWGHSIQNMKLIRVYIPRMEKKLFWGPYLIVIGLEPNYGAVIVHDI